MAVLLFYHKIGIKYTLGLEALGYYSLNFLLKFKKSSVLKYSLAEEILINIRVRKLLFILINIRIRESLCLQSLYRKPLRY